MSENIFDGTPDKGENVAPVVNPAPTSGVSVPPELAELVGEGKKYASVDAALRSLPHAQSHISKLESELATLREDLGKRKTTQELLDELKSGIPQGETTPKEGLSQDTVVKMVEQIINQKKVQEQSEINKQKVVDSFKEAFGDQAQTYYSKVAAEAGLSIAELNRIALSSPLAVLKLAGITKSTTVPVVPGKVKSDVNTTAMDGQPNTLSAKVQGTSTKDLVNAWKIAGEKVRQSLES